MITPDEYRYAKAHLRAALVELGLVKHYLRSTPGETLRVIESADDDLRCAYVACQDLSQKDFVPAVLPGGVHPPGHPLHEFEQTDLANTEEARKML